MYAYNTPLYEHKTFYTHTKHFVCIHKLCVHVQHIINGTHIFYTCSMVVYVSSYKNFLTCKKWLVRVYYLVHIQNILYANKIV